MWKRNRWSTRLATLIVACGMLAFASSALAVRMTAAFPVDAPTQFIIQPGESTTFAIDFVNLDNSAGSGVAWVRHFLPGFGTSWLIEPLQPDVCLHPIAAEGLRIDFQVELQANESRRCRYTLTRAAATFSDGYLQMCPGEHPVWYCPSFDRLVFGTLPDVGVTVTSMPSTPSAATDFTYRIDVTNASAVATRALTLYNQCREPEAADPANLPFRLEVGFAGACPTATVRGCSPELPLTLFGWQVTVTSIPANGTTSCLVRVRVNEPFDVSINDRFAIWSLYPFEPGHPIPLLHAGAQPNQGQGYDMNRANDLAAFRVAPAAVDPTPVPLGNPWLWSLLAFLLPAWICYARRKQPTCDCRGKWCRRRWPARMA